MSNDGPNYNDKKVFTNIMQNSGTTDLLIYHYIPNKYNFKGINKKNFKYGSEMWSRIYICIDLLRYIDCTFS